MAYGISPELDRRRREWLQASVSNFVGKGYRVLSQTDYTAQLVKPKQFSIILAILCLIFGIGVGLLIYIVIYMMMSDQTVYLDANKIV